MILSKEENKKEKSFNRRWAKFWQVSVRTITEWKREGLKVSKTNDVIAWAAGRKSMSEGFRRKLAELKAEQQAQGASTAELQSAKIQPDDPDWLAYQEKKKLRKAGDKPDQDTLQDFREVYATKLARCIQFKGDQAEAKFLTDQLVRLDKALRETMIMENRLGIEAGETISRADCERWFRAWAFWTMREIDALLMELCPKVAGLSPGLTVEGVRNVVEPALLECRMVRAFAGATRIASPLALPDWAVAVAKDAIDDYIENGAAMFEAEYIKPLAAKNDAS